MTEPLPQNPRPKTRAGVVVVVMAAILLIIAALWFFRGVPSEAWGALQNADRYELLSLHPDLMRNGVFHGYVILGSTVVTDQAIQKQLNDALQNAARSSDRVATCFEPRHGIRVTKGSVITDFVICFECFQVKVFRSDKQLAYFTISSAPRAAFDQALTAAGVTLAPPEWEPIGATTVP